MVRKQNLGFWCKFNLLNYVYLFEQEYQKLFLFLFHACIYIYRMSQAEWTKLRESVPYVKIYRFNPKHLYPKLNGYGDNGQRNLKV